ncbi:PAS domain-containing sensor histidine kinase [Magnetovibrio sp. PR-2]|uniref:sensor histidine kinase n=1 Tax=Magnetovibrio sp. PR-2 TaxID=3120356 RepID=UPI002FCDF54E
MITNLHRQNRFVFAVMIGLLSAVVSLASLKVFEQQKDLLLGEIEEATHTELELLGGVLSDAMLRNDYSEGRRVLAEWPINHHDVAALRVVMDNGRTFFSYAAEEDAQAVHEKSKSFQYGPRTLTITLTHNAKGLAQTLTQLSRNLLYLTLLIIALLSAILWFILFHWMIKPMEQEIAHQTKALRTAKDNLEQQVAERTQSLSTEVDIRKKAELSLRKLVRIVDQSPIIVFITDTEGTIEYVNPKFEEVTGYSAAEAVGQKPSLLRSPDTPPEVHQQLWETILAGHDWSSEIKDVCKDGSDFWASVHISPIRNEHGEISHFAALHENISERKMAEEAMHDARRAAEMANNAKTELLANMSHELRTPLNAIIGFADTIKHEFFGPIDNPQYKEYISFIHSSGSHLLELINDILDVTAIEAGKLKLREEEVDIREICDTSLQIVTNRAVSEAVDIRGIDNASLPRLYADPLRLKQVFINLLCNAVKFTPEDGNISCHAKVTESGDMVVSIVDSGIGMSDKELAKAMDKFGQVDSSLARKHEGTGLGLPLTKGLIELHDGVFEISSEPGQGTQINMRFPAARVLSQDEAANA